MSDSFYSFSEPFNSGIDFFNADDAILITSAISGEVIVAVSSLKIALSSATLSADADMSATARRIVFANIHVSDILASTVVVGRERHDGSVVISSEVLVAVNAIKIAKASASISSDASLSAVGKKISLSSVSVSIESAVSSTFTKVSKAISAISPLSSMSITGTKLVLASAILSGQINLATAGRIFLATIKINILNNTNISAKSIKFAVDGIMDLSAIQSYMLIDDKPITSHNRKFDSSLEPIFVQNKNWNNRKTRYYKSTSRSGRRVFNLSWSWLPGSQDHTVDGNRARDFINSIASDPSHHTFKIINLDETGTTPPTEASYNVLVKDYSETLVRRDLDNGVYWWDCSISMEEV